jgi:tRNA U34 5-methylaminomethyl-2-thiouridine-forming methyltransferase MnmC
LKNILTNPSYASKKAGSFGLQTNFLELQADFLKLHVDILELQAGSLELQADSLGTQPGTKEELPRVT